MGISTEVDGIECPFCSEQLWSKYRHDFHYCGCGYCFVDGGRDYLRCGWGIPWQGTDEQKAEALFLTKVIGEPKLVKIQFNLKE